MSKQYKPTTAESLQEVGARLQVLESYAERQSAINLMLMEHLKRIIREKEVLLMHVGLSSLARDNPEALTPSQRIMAAKSDELLRQAAARARSAGL